MAACPESQAPDSLLCVPGPPRVAGLPWPAGLQVNVPPVLRQSQRDASGPSVTRSVVTRCGTPGPGPLQGWDLNYPLLAEGGVCLEQVPAYLPCDGFLGSREWKADITGLQIITSQSATELRPRGSGQRWGPEQLGFALTWEVRAQHLRETLPSGGARGAPGVCCCLHRHREKGVWGRVGEGSFVAFTIKRKKKEGKREREEGIFQIRTEEKGPKGLVV